MLSLDRVGKELASIPHEAADALKMKPIQYLVWFSCWSCWTLASMQYYTLPFTTAVLAKDLDVLPSRVQVANTTSMLSRSLGAIIFGIASDQYGRKWPLMVNLFFLAVFSVASGFVSTIGQLIGVRLLFGIAYGGTYGLVMAMVLEAVPRRSRGVVAGFTQQGFAAGYLLASGLHLAMSSYTWAALYWLAGGLTLPVAIIRLFVPFYSVTAEHLGEMEGTDVVDPRAAVGGKLSFTKKLAYLMKHHRLAFIYAACLTACFNTFGHGAFDLYPTFLTVQRHLTVLQETHVTIIMQMGGIIGGIVGGFLSHKFNPKWCAGTFALCCAPWLPLWVLPTQWGHMATGAFFLQFFYGCAIGNLGNILQQLCPHPGMRAAFTGVSYNIGNAISSIAPTVESELGERYPLPNGTPNYALTQMIWVGIMIGLLAICLFSMPLKKLNKEWDQEDPNSAIPDHDIPAVKDSELGMNHIAPDRDNGKPGDDGKQGAAHIEHLETI